MADELILGVGGQRFAGWQSASILRSMERGPHLFELRLSNRWRASQHRAIRAGESARLFCGNDLLLTGFIDSVSHEYDDETQSIRIAGRSALGDLVDCSAIGREFVGQRLDAIARELARPFGIEVAVAADIGAAFPRVRLDEGQSPWEFIELLARIRGVRVLGDAQGQLQICSAGSRLAGVPLVLGDNVQIARAELSCRERFSEYHLVAKNGDVRLDIDATQIAHINASAIDPHIKRHRPLTIVADEDCNRADCLVQAEWQRNIRYGRGQRLLYNVRGWREGRAGNVWEPNTRVQVNDAYLGLRQELLLVEVRLLLDEEGRYSELVAMPRQAMAREPLPEPAEGWL